MYRGKVRAPKSGRFRFVGTADDLIAVRFGNRMVLEAGWCIPSTYSAGQGIKTGTRGALKSPHGQAYHQAIKEGQDPNHKRYVIAPYEGVPKWNGELGGLTAGTPFRVKEGDTYPIEILISDVAGAAFGFVLLLDEYDEETKSWKFPGETLDLFRTNFSEPNKIELEKMLLREGCLEGPLQCPPYNPDSPIWAIVP